MAEEKPKTQSVKVRKESGNSGEPDLLKSALKRPSAETSDRKEKGILDRKDSGNRDQVRSNIGTNLVKVGKEFSKGGARDQEGRVAGKEGKVSVKQEDRASVKIEAKSLVKVSSKEIKVLSKKDGNVNGEELGKSVGKNAGKVNGKEQIIKESVMGNGKVSGGVRDLIKPKNEIKDREREREKRKVSVVETQVRSASNPKVTPKSTNAGASSSVIKRKVTTTTVTTTKSLVEQRKEKKVYDLPGQKHEPPEERDALRVFYSTLREQIPESEMAEIWLMEHGLLLHDEAQKAFERKQKKGQSSKHGTISKFSIPSRLSNGSPGVKKSIPVSNGKSKEGGSSSKGKRKRECFESDSDDDFLAKVAIKKKSKS
ncbi:uncharacterized protein [Physcomitrium patens]|uniref:Uncharacterized protein n=2 Tax=Physcomitrium patens TaxID=3218 RepID=A9SRC3_PHYPA|nr:uncharacterized protein LOC112290131 isoform X2 [Physcomitrium patens]XP_024391891.1 uncharacterized protein LOC112290131 isoform X2 [Physcomitrium patens]|eukprot:XP_024391890.1 uncharacterized protein LOC112290131 isoform X2 [Physcomitrella patens]